MSGRCREHVGKMSGNVGRMSERCRKDVGKMSERCREDVGKMSERRRKDVGKMSERYDIGQCFGPSNTLWFEGF